MTVRVFTNNQARELIPWHELPEDQQKFFDYLDEEEKFDYRFVKYRGSWIDVRDMQIINGGTIGDFPVLANHPLYGWHGVQSDSVWTGTIFRYLRAHEAFARGLNQYDYVIVGRYSE